MIRFFVSCHPWRQPFGPLLRNVRNCSRQFFVSALLLAATALATSPARAWGPLGHRLVARLAESRLAPEAHAEAMRLLALDNAASLADVSTWADELRAHDPELGRRSARWHYVNIGEHDCHYEAARDCPGGDCIVEAIEAQAAILADHSRPDAERLQALKFVVHFVGDAHQPMHAGYARDRGGNSVQVNLDGRGSNLHAIWDTPLLRSRGLGEDDYFRELEARLPARDALRVIGTPAAWAEQACRIVLQPGVYPPRARIGQDYLHRHRPTAEQAVLEAGARLAVLLNDVLAPPAEQTAAR